VNGFQLQLIVMSKKKDNSRFDFIDLYAGTGGISIPFRELQGNEVFASEWDKFAQNTYEANFETIPIGDIGEIEPEAIPKHTLLLAGFPCQPFSNAGLKKGFADIRGTQFFIISKIVEYHRPKILFLENVKGFRSHEKGNTFSVVKKIIEEDLNYTLFTKVLNAKDFGVPQNRERFYMIAFDNNIYPDGVDFEFPEPLGIKTKVGDILQKEKVDDKYTISDKLWAGHQRRKEMHAKKGNGFGYSMFNSKSPYTSTISARYYKDGSEILIEQKNKNPRKLTPREAANLQGYPADYKIVVSDVQAYKQFGNAVAVPVIRAIAQKLDKYL
jgi:DNA (cytosine-5)-methyltransferase 1